MLWSTAASSRSFTIRPWPRRRPLYEQLTAANSRSNPSPARLPLAPLKNRWQERKTGAVSSLPEGGSTKKELLLNKKEEGPSTDLRLIFQRFWTVASPYWMHSDEAAQARMRLAGVTALTLGTTGVSVLFNFLGRDFFNYLSEKDVENFYLQLQKYLGAFAVGIPVFVLRDYYLQKLGLEWRQWMTEKYLKQYLDQRAFYTIQSEALIDNPDQRITSDVTQFCDSALELVFTFLRAAVDLVSFSGILFGIYPPLFVALAIYSIGGTGISIYLGRPLVGLNFNQEALEADLRYGLVRLRENHESIAFYGGEGKEEQLLRVRLRNTIINYGALLITSRNLEFFTSSYRYLISVLPVAVVAPLYFKGEIEFGVVNQSSSAFSHILQDVSLIVFQFQALAGFSAVVDRLGEFSEALEACSEEQDLVTRTSTLDQTIYGTQDQKNFNDTFSGTFISLRDIFSGEQKSDLLLSVDNLTLKTPNCRVILVKDLTLKVIEGQHLLIMGPSGSGKTSILRAVAGLWNSGDGTVTRYISCDTKQLSLAEGSGECTTSPRDVFFMPQKPYTVLGALRDQLLYPCWADLSNEGIVAESELLRRGDDKSSDPILLDVPRLPELPKEQGQGQHPEPTEEDMEAVLDRVRLTHVLQRIRARRAAGSNVLDTVADWSGELSLGEQQRLAFARVLLAKPRFLLMDESTSALDQDNQDHLYQCLKEDGITFVSVGHRPSLLHHHDKVLQLSTYDGEERVKNWRIVDVDGEVIRTLTVSGPR